MKYAVKIAYPTILPLYAEETFVFGSDDEANKFVAKADKQEGWKVYGPWPYQDAEVHTVDSAMGWVSDEQAACAALVF